MKRLIQSVTAHSVPEQRAPHNLRIASTGFPMIKTQGNTGISTLPGTATNRMTSTTMNTIAGIVATLFAVQG